MIFENNTEISITLRETLDEMISNNMILPNARE